MVPVKHHTHSKVGRRRSHLALKKVAILVCPQCKGPIVPHRACNQCGAYGKKQRATTATRVEKSKTTKTKI
ncbi:MAG: 50S ribosomal protein L32 [Patescibacteria group bacterium]